MDFWTRGKIILVSVLGFIVIVGGSVIYPIAANEWWAYTAPTISAAQEKQQVYTAQNRINEYKEFYADLESYNTDLEAVKTNESTLANFSKEYTPAEISADPTGNLEQLQSQDVSAVSGAETICVSAAQTYNLNSDEIVTGAQFKSVTLPKSVSPNACNQ